MQAYMEHSMTAAARRLTLLLLTVIYGFGFIDRVVIALVAQSIKTDLLISDLQIGLLAGTAFSIVNIFAALPLARIAERSRRSLVVAGSLLVGSIFTALCAATTSFVQLIVLRVGMAAGSAGTEAPAHSMISDMYPPGRRTSALSVFMLGVPLASIVGSYAGGTIAQAYGWRATFLALGIPGVVVAVLALCVMPEPSRQAVRSEFPSDGRSITATFASVWRQAHCRHVLLGMALVSLGSFGVNTFLPTFFARDFGLGVGRAGLIFGLIVGIASAGGSLVGGFGSERLARRHPGWLMGVPGIGLFIGAPLLVLGITRSTLESAIALLLVGSCFFYMAMAPAIAVVHGVLDSRSRATGSALFLMFVHFIGQGLGPPLAGFASDKIAAWQFGSGDFAQACAGATLQAVGSPCATASAAGIRYAIASFALFYLWAGAHFISAARKLPRLQAEPPLGATAHETRVPRR
jgi:predicted MFS family arabinose efflux permease